MSTIAWIALIVGLDIVVDLAVIALFMGRDRFMEEARARPQSARFDVKDVEARYVEAEFARIAAELDGLGSAVEAPCRDPSDEVTDRDRFS